jgi:hypothetical protein
LCIVHGWMWWETFTLLQGMSRNLPLK